MWVEKSDKKRRTKKVVAAPTPSAPKPRKLYFVKGLKAIPGAYYEFDGNIWRVIEEVKIRSKAKIKIEKLDQFLKPLPLFSGNNAVYVDRQDFLWDYILAGQPVPTREEVIAMTKVTTE